MLLIAYYMGLHRVKHGLKESTAVNLIELLHMIPSELQF